MERKFFNNFWNSINENNYDFFNSYFNKIFYINNWNIYIRKINHNNEIINTTDNKSYIKSFNYPNYTNSNFLNLIYRKYVLDEDVGNISLPPYFTYDFFDNIITVRNEGYDAINMSIKQWYQFFLGRNVLNGNNFEPLPCKAEIENSDLMWPEIWKSIRDPSFTSITVSFMFKLTHKLLPTESRLQLTLLQILFRQITNCWRWALFVWLWSN